MEKLTKIGKFIAESEIIANEVKKVLINKGFIISQDDEFNHVLQIYKNEKSK